MAQKDTEIKPTWWASLIPLAILVALLFFVVRNFGADALGGASQVALIIASGVIIAISIFVYKCPWKHLEKAISDNIRNVASALVILLLIGAISGTWMLSGVVPTLMCYGLNIISPRIFLFAVCIICALVSIMTGSSWTTIATIGVALIGIGEAQGFSPAWTAGAIISGAYFGDKVSPLSDTTVLASSTVETPLFQHIRYMLITTVPSFVIACTVFLVVSIIHDSVSAAEIDEASLALHNAFNISPWLLLVPVATGVLIARRVPAIITLLSAAVLASLAAVIFQPQLVMQIGGIEDAQSLEWGGAFRGVMISWFDSTSIDTGNETYNSLVATRGMNGMLSTVFLIICAATFGGVFTGSGMLQSLTDLLIRKVESRTAIVASTVGTGIFANCATGDQYLSIILTCSLYKKLYKDKGYENRLLSRSAEDSATVTSVLIPWNSCGMTQSTVLHVATLEYLPYCFFNLVSPLMSIFIAAIGYKIIKK